MEQEWGWAWWWWVMGCMLGWGGSSFLMGWAGRNLPYTHSFFYNTIGMALGVALVVMTMEEDVNPNTKDGKEGARGHSHDRYGELRRRDESVHHAAGGTSLLDFDGLLGWQDGSVAIFSGIAAALADIAFYQLARMGMSVSVAGPISGLYLTVPAVLGVVILGEAFTWAKAAGLLLAILAIYLLSEGEEETDVPSTTQGDDETPAQLESASSSDTGAASSEEALSEKQAPLVTRRREAVRAPQVELATNHS